MRLKSTYFATALAAVALLGAGCGDDDDETTTTTTTTSGASGATGATGEAGSATALPAEFIDEADAICAEGDDAIDAEAEETFQDGQPSEKDQLAFVEDTVVPNVRQQLKDLKALDPPAEGADDFQALLDNANDALDQIESDPQAFIGGEDPFVEVNKQAQELGLQACGGG